MKEYLWIALVGGAAVLIWVLNIGNVRIKTVAMAPDTLKPLIPDILIPKTEPTDRNPETPGGWVDLGEKPIEGGNYEMPVTTILPGSGRYSGDLTSKLPKIGGVGVSTIPDFGITGSM